MIFFTPEECNRICSNLDSEAKWFPPKYESSELRMSIYTLPNGHFVSERIASMLKETALHDREIDTVRIHRFGVTDRVMPHVDSAYPGCDAIIVRLDSNIDSRLYIGDLLISEMTGHGMLVPENTVHSVSSGRHERVTAVAWIKNKTGV